MILLIFLNPPIFLPVRGCRGAPDPLPTPVPQHGLPRHQGRNLGQHQRGLRSPLGGGTEPDGCFKLLRELAAVLRSEQFRGLLDHPSRHTV